MQYQLYMKEIKILETTKVLSDREADLLCSVLWSLGIYPEITALERKNRNITLASILPEMQPRTASRIRAMLDDQVYISLNIFMENYSWRDFMKMPGVGRKSLSDLRSVLQKYGYKTF